MFDWSVDSMTWVPSNLRVDWIECFNGMFFSRHERSAWVFLMSSSNTTIRKGMSKRSETRRQDFYDDE